MKRWLIVQRAPAGLSFACLVQPAQNGQQAVCCSLPSYPHHCCPGCRACSHGGAAGGGASHSIFCRSAPALQKYGGVFVY